MKEHTEGGQRSRRKGGKREREEVVESVKRRAKRQYYKGQKLEYISVYCTWLL